MEKAKGPLELLKKFKENQVRVKIYIRKEHGVRGFVTGFIEVFDKHLNIALTDCVEQWKRRKYKFSENKVALLGQPKDCSSLLAKLGIEIPEITVKSLNRKYVECSRRIPQLMVRGEEVVLVGEDTKEADGCQGYTPNSTKNE
jgi:small nuclear ribonucleoprotein (snRNP)-like protein